MQSHIDIFLMLLEKGDKVKVVDLAAVAKIEDNFRTSAPNNRNWRVKNIKSCINFGFRFNWKAVSKFIL